MRRREPGRSLEAEQDTSAPTPSIPETDDSLITIRLHKWALLAVGVMLTLALGFVIGYPILRLRSVAATSAAGDAPLMMQVGTRPAPSTTVAGDKRTQNSLDVPAMYRVQPASAEVMFSEFICSCCGQLVAECSCGMAVERRAFVSGMNAVGANRLDMYLAYADTYGLGTFISWEAQHVVKQHKLANAPPERPQIVLDVQEIDLGDVSVSGRQVETGVTITNTGQKDLVVESLSTSCGCTTAALVSGGQEGPTFGAGTPSEDWTATIEPGSSAELRIYFDPSFHPDARGPMMRQVYVSTNDPVDPHIKVTIKLTQVD